MPEKLMNPNTNVVQEIEYCQRMKHKHIVSFVDSGCLDTEEGGCQYYLTNYFTGELLSEKTRREGRVAETEAVEIYKRLLEGLKYMHQQGICHNDITPRNIMLSAVTDGVPEIIDLGHASQNCAGKVVFDTSDLEVLYSANETFVGIYDEQSDIFAVTAVLYAMTMGECPWNMEFPEGMKRARKAVLLKEYRKEHPIEFSSLNVEDKVKGILAKGLSVDYNERYRSVDEVLRDINADEVPLKPAKSEKEELQKGNATGFNNSVETPNKVDFEIKRGNGNGFKDIAGMDELKSG